MILKYCIAAVGIVSLALAAFMLVQSKSMNDRIISVVFILFGISFLVASYMQHINNPYVKVVIYITIGLTWFFQGIYEWFRIKSQ